MITFRKKTELPIYICIAEAVEALADVTDPSEGETLPNLAPKLTSIRDAAERAETALSPLSSDELKLASQLIKGHCVVEVPGKWNRPTDAAPENIILHETRVLISFITAPCKQEVSLMKQTRHVRQASNLFNKMDPVRQTLLRAIAGQYGRDSAHCSLSTIRVVATMDCPSALAHDEILDASLLCAATLHIFVLPHDYARLENHSLPKKLLLLPCSFVGSRRIGFPP